LQHCLKFNFYFNFFGKFFFFSISNKTQTNFRALYDFVPEEPNELPLKSGDVVVVLQKNENGWYGGERAGKLGFFPSSYVEIISTSSKIF